MLKYLPLFSLLFIGCINPEDRCRDFCKGDTWQYENYKMNTYYTTTYPLKKDEVLISIEEGLKDWQVVADNKIALTDKPKNKKMVFTFEIHADTLILKAENNYISKLMIRENSTNKMHLELIGSFRGDLYMRK